jgi:hypothetical protein
VDEAAVERLLAKLRRFADEELDEAERVVLASLLAPAIAVAYGESEVSGFGTTELAPLPEVLLGSLRRSGLRVVGLEPDR